MVPFQNFFAERIFDLCDFNHSGTTNISNILNLLVKVTNGTPTQRLKFLFEIYDVDGMLNLWSINRDQIRIEDCDLVRVAASLGKIISSSQIKIRDC